MEGLLVQFISNPTLMTSLIHLDGQNGMEMKGWTLYIMESENDIWT